LIALIDEISLTGDLYRALPDANLDPAQKALSYQVIQLFVQDFVPCLAPAIDADVSHAVLRLSRDASLTHSIEASPCNLGRHLGWRVEDVVDLLAEVGRVLRRHEIQCMDG
jgi:hypothetical protein